MIWVIFMNGGELGRVIQQKCKYVYYLILKMSDFNRKPLFVFFNLNICNILSRCNSCELFLLHGLILQQRQRRKVKLDESTLKAKLTGRRKKDPR